MPPLTAALAAGGRTLAILGSGVLNIYPPENCELAIDVRKRGALMSKARHAANRSAAPSRNGTGLSAACHSAS